MPVPTVEDQCKKFYEMFDPNFKGQLPENYQDQIKEVLLSLTPSEEKVLKARLGLNDGIPKTLEEAGESIHRSGEVVRGLEAKALRKLKNENSHHPLLSGGNNLGQDEPWGDRYTFKVPTDCIHDVRGDHDTVAVDVPQLQSNGGEVPLCTAHIPRDAIIGNEDGVTTLLLPTEATYPVEPGYIDKPVCANGEISSQGIMNYWQGFDVTKETEFQRRAKSVTQRGGRLDAKRSDVDLNRAKSDDKVKNDPNKSHPSHDD